MKTTPFRKLSSFLLLAILFLGVLAIFAPPAHAASITVSTLSTNTFSYLGGTISLSPNVGDVVVLEFEGVGCPGSGNIPSGSGCNNVLEYGMSSVTDSVGDVWTRQKIIGQYSSPTGSAANCFGSGNRYECFAEIWTTVAQSSSMTVTYATPFTECSGCGGYYQVFDASNASPTPTNSCSSYVSEGTSVYMGLYPCQIAGTTYAVFAAALGSNTGVWSAGSGYTLYSYTTNAPGQAEYSTNIAAASTFPFVGFPMVQGSSTFAVQVGIVLGFAISSSTQTQITGDTNTCGSSPTHTLGHSVLTNATQYWYSSNALGQEIVNSISVVVAKTVGSGTHYLTLVLYGTMAQGLGGSQTPSVVNPAIILLQRTYALTSGTQNSTITLQTNIPLNSAYSNPLPFNYWAVGIIGDNKIWIYNSGVSGITTQSGTATTSSSVQPNLFTNRGTSSGSMLKFCAIASYQSVISLTTTITSTQSASTVSTIFSTYTVSTINAQVLLSNNTNWPLIFLFLLFPAGLFMGATRSLSGGLIGLIIGAVIGIMAGVLPSWIFIGLVVAVVAVAFVVRERNT